MNVIRIVLTLSQSITKFVAVKLPGDPKKSRPLFGVSGGTQVFAK